MKKRTLHIITWKEDKLFVAKFIELELASQGKTKKEALANLQEALDLFMEDEDKNSLEFPSVEEVSTQTHSFS